MLPTSFSKHSVLIPRGQSVSAVTGGVEYFREDRQHTCTISFPERLCAVYLRENIQPLLSRPTTSIGDKQQSKVADLAKYVHLPEVGTFQVSISVTKS